MKSLAVCVLILAVVGLSSCASRHRRQSPAAAPEGAIPEDAAAAIPAAGPGPLNNVVSLMILKEKATAELTGSPDPKGVQKIQTLLFIIPLTGDTVTDDNMQGFLDLQKMLEEATTAAPAAAAEPAADPASV